MASKYVDFVVEGRGVFPLDMLRYDECYPVNGDDAALLDSFVQERRKIMLRSLSQMQYGKPTVERWRSFGWSVVHIVRN